MSDLGFWKKDYTFPDGEHEESAPATGVSESDRYQGTLTLEDSIWDLYFALQNRRDELNVEVLDQLDIIKLRKWIGNYVPQTRRCFRQ